MDKAAAAFDVFCTSPEGYDAHYQLSGDKVFDQSTRLLKALKDAGFTPRPTGNGKGHGTRSASTEGAGPIGEICQIHHAMMKRHENDKGAWFSHKLQDGSWCYGKAK